MNQWDRAPAGRPQMDSGYYNEALGVQHQTRGFKNLCYQWDGDQSTIPEHHCVIRLEAGFEPGQKTPWVGSLNGEFCTILKGVPSVVPNKFVIFIAETWETDYIQENLHRGLIPHPKMRWPFSVIVPPKGDDGVQLMHLTNHTIGAGEEYAYVARAKKTVYPKAEKKAKEPEAPPARAKLEQELKRLEAAPLQLRNFQV